MDHEPSKPNMRKRNVVIVVSCVLTFVVLFLAVFEYYREGPRFRSALCHLRDKTFVQSYSSMGYISGSGRCMKNAIDYKKNCISNTECASGLCNPPEIDWRNQPIQPTISSLRAKNPTYISGTCSKVEVSQTKNSQLIGDLFIST